MEQIGFIGAFDKKDLLLNIAKVLTNLGMRTLIVDATSMQRFRYIVPMVSNTPTPTYISEYQGIDVAMGFMNLNGIAQYSGTSQLQYDFIIIDTDNIQTLNSFMIPVMKKVFLVTSFDAYDVQRTIETLKFVQQPMEITKVILSADITLKQEEYLNHLISETKVKISNDKVVFADTIVDRKATLENQLIKEIKLKRYTSTYRDSLEYIISMIAEKVINQAEIRRTIKRM